MLRFLFRILRTLFITAVGLSCLLTMAGFYGQQNWLLDLASHFRPAYLLLQFVGLAALALGFGLNRSNHLFIFMAILLVLPFAWVNFCLVQPYFPVSQQEVNPSKNIRVLQINVLGYNKNIQAVARQIQLTDPDVLSLQEYTQRWEEKLNKTGVLKAFPYHYVARPLGNGIYSKLPFSDKPRTEYSSEFKHDATTVTHLRAWGKTLTFVFVHPLPPVRPDWTERYNQMYRQWEGEYQNWGPNLVMIGDFNATPWSYRFSHLLKRTKLHDSHMGFGIQASWPVYLIKHSRNIYMPFPLVPIDHVLTSKDYIVQSSHTGGYTGSDHLPVIVDLALK